MMNRAKLMSFGAAFVLCVAAMPAAAEIPAGSAQTQQCSTNADCTLVSQNCATSCATLPINNTYAQRFTDQRNATCGNDIAGMPNCNVNPPLQPSCINNRCTIGYAFQNNSHDGDYRNKDYQGAGASSSPQRHDLSYIAPSDSPTVRNFGEIVTAKVNAKQ